MAADPLETARTELSAAPLEDWVAERGRLAKALKADGETDAAKELAKEPKPSAAEWAVGRIADEDPDAVAEWNGTAAALRDASGTKGAGDALREAMAAHREATESLVDTIGERIEPNGRPLSAAMLERVRELLQEATADPEGLGGIPPRTQEGEAASPAPKTKAGKKKADRSPSPTPRRRSALVIAPSSSRPSPRQRKKPSACSRRPTRPRRRRRPRRPPPSGPTPKPARPGRRPRPRPRSSTGCSTRLDRL